MAANDYEKCAKIIRKGMRESYGRGTGSAWSMLVPAIRTALVRSAVLGIVHGWADDDRGRTVTEGEIEGLLRAALAEFGDEIE